MPHSPFESYKPGFGLHIPGILLAAVLSVIGAIILGALYAILVHYITVEKICFCLPLLFGGVAGLLAGCLLNNLGHVRPRAFCVAVSILFVLLAYLVSWSVWLHAVIQWQGLITPHGYITLLSNIYEKGAYASRGAPVAGLQLAVIWTCEFLTFMGIGALGALVCAEDTKPYCLSCRAWTKSVDLDGKFDSPQDLPALQTQLASGNIDSLFDLAPLPPDRIIYIHASIFRCPKCDAFKTLLVRRQEMILKDGQKHSEKTTLRLAHLIIDTPSYEKMAGLFEAARDASFEATMNDYDASITPSETKPPAP